MKYGREYKVRMVNDRGFINLNQKRVFVGNPFTGYQAGVREYVDRGNEAWFGIFLLGTINEDTGLIEPVCCIVQTKEKT